MDTPGGTPVRITRQERYLFYRASDGARYLGISEWSATLGRFAPPQPIAGPFERASRGSARTSFVYFDAAGALMVPDGANERTVSRECACAASRPSQAAERTGFAAIPSTSAMGRSGAP